MVSSVTTSHSSYVYSPDGVDELNPNPAPSGESDSSPPPPPPSGESDLPSPTTSNSLSSASILELGFAFDHMQTDMEDVMKLIYDWASKTRQAQKEVRQHELQAQVDVLMCAAQKLRDAAEENFKAAVVAGAMGIAAGFFSIACSATALKQSLKSIKFDNKATAASDKSAQLTATKGGEGVDLEANAALADELQRMSQKWSSMAKGLSAQSQPLIGIGSGTSSILNSIGQIAAAEYKRKADQDIAESKELDALATTHQAIGEHANEWVHEMQDLMQDILQKMQALIQLQHDTNSKIVG